MQDHGGIACSFCTHNAGNQCALLWLVLKHFFSAGAWEKCKTDAFFQDRLPEMQRLNISPKS